jgi:FkbM family methyltransferase
MLRGFINSCHHFFAKSGLFVKLSLLIRNQCYSIIAYHLANTPDFTRNGESAIVDFLAPKCSIVLDAGANKGLWSAYFLNKNVSVKILAFEPSSNAFNLLQAKFNLVSNITLIKKGLSDEEKQSIFFEEPDCGETSSVVPQVSNRYSMKTEIQLTTVDRVIKEYKLPEIDFLKIDVEGLDLFVLKGASENLKAKKIKFIQFEYNSSWAFAGSTLIQALRFLEDYGYKPYLLRSDGLYELNYKRYGEYFRYSNFFALPGELNPIIQPLLRGTI